MQPDFNREISGIVQQWYDAAEGNIGHKEEKQLYENTAHVVNTLRELKNSGQTEKVNEFSKILIQQFDNHGIGESEILAKWVAVHNPNGAYQSLHQLFELVAEINEYPQAFTTEYDNSAPAWYLSTIINVDASALNYIENSPNELEGLKINELRKLIFQNLNLKQLQSLGSTSQHFNALIKSELIDLLNHEKIKLKDLHFKSITQIINYFGEENCAKMTRLNLEGVYNDGYFHTTKNGDLKMEKDINVGKYFPNLTHFTLNNYDDYPIDVEDLKLPSKLESLDISKTTLNNLNFLDGLKLLKKLNISQTYINTETFLKSSSLFEKLDSLEDLDVSNTFIYDFESIKELPKLSKFCFEIYSVRQRPDFSCLKKCKSLTNLVIRGGVKDNECKFLELPNLIHLNISNELENYDFLSACKALKSFNLYININTENLSFTEKCPTITELSVGVYSGMGKLKDLSHLKSLKQLEKLELSSLQTDISVLEECTTLKEITLNWCRVPKNQVESLRSKGITVNLSNTNLI